MQPVDPNKTVIGAPTLDPNRTVIGSPVAVDPNKTRAMGAMDPNKTSMMAPIVPEFALSASIISSRDATMANGPAREQFLLELSTVAFPDQYQFAFHRRRV